MLTPTTIEITEANLHQAIEQSMSVPVLFYFGLNAASTACN